VFETQDPDSRMRLIDFGIAKQVEPKQVIQGFCGSRYYIAPELLPPNPMVMTGEIWKAADMWSVGVILFLLVCGYAPFGGKTDAESFMKTKVGRFSFPRKKGPNDYEVSDSVKDLIRKILKMDPGQRLSAREALQHPWIVGETASEVLIPAHVIESLQDFSAKAKLRAAVGRVLTNEMMTEQDKENVAALFKKYDKNGDGKLQAQELADMMKDLNWDKSADLAKMVEALDEDKDGEIDLNEFAKLEAMSKLSRASDQDLKKVFNQFDIDGNGYVTALELATVCESFMDPAAVQELIKGVDHNGDGQLSFEEWVSAMRSNMPQLPVLADGADSPMADAGR